MKSACWKKWGCILLCLMLLPMSVPNAAAEESAPNVRVLLRRLALTDRIDLRLSCPFLASWGKDSRMRIPAGSSITVQVRENRLVSRSGCEPALPL